MEEVDSIILHFLRQLNINIDNEIKNLSELSVQSIVESASKCLLTINPSLKVPAHLPPGVSQRIEVAALIAAACKDLGCKNDVGYQTFLYYNEAELRQVFMFLIERLPREGKQTKSSEPCTEKSLFLQTIGQKIAQDLNSIWVPHCCKVSKHNSIGDHSHSTATGLPPISKIPLTAEEMLKKLQKAQAFNKGSATKDPAAEQNESPDEELVQTVPEINKSLIELKEMAIVLRQKLDALESERNCMDVEYSQAKKSNDRVEADLKNLQNILESIGIHDTEENTDHLLEKVQRNIEDLHVKSEKWTSKNLSLKVEIDKLKGASSVSERSRCRQILVNLKENAKAMKADYKKNEEIRDQLKIKYEKLKGGNKRSIYTKRIMEIISNVDKQNLEIHKILEDIRQLQKEINSLEGQLDRCFTIADETLFRDAKKDDQAKKAYKLLALLHSECNSIVSLVNDTGTLARDIVDLEDNIKTEADKRTEDTLHKIQQDLARMQQEASDNYKITHS